MQKIKEAFDIVEQKIVSITEYSSILKNNKHYSNIKNLKCPECGDILLYCNGNVKEVYFKHDGAGKDHNDCSLYNKTISKASVESKMRKKLVFEDGINFNYQLEYKNGSWKEYIIFPPFEDAEIENYEKNETLIRLTDKKNAKNIKNLEINFENFQSGLVKKVRTFGFIEKLTIEISGKDYNNTVNYIMDCFIPETQIYSALFFTKLVNSTLKNEFICKKQVGNIFIGRHYLIFSYNEKIYCRCKEDISINKITLIKNNEFSFYAFDIVFNKISKDSLEFCEQRNCKLTDRNDAVILWPPLKIIENYRYYDNLFDKMYITVENYTKSNKLIEYSLKELNNSDTKPLIKVSNINENSFYIMLDKSDKKQKKCIDFQEKNFDENIDYKCEKYYLNNGILIEKYEDQIIGKRNELLLVFNKLQRIKVKNKVIDNLSIINFLNLVRYSKEYIEFTQNQYKYFYNKFTKNPVILDYLEYCSRLKKIKRKVFEALLEEDDYEYS